ncbi:type II secretion system F family protein [Methylobacillus gramineus]|uniref:type II secretion system F family protein n=1 Tax=Methylobacillus gramineus TaxID=755169 RepID=UPI001CFF6C74|nr:type II secretion system F family protein [Methylobacillus gramineus]MCB5184475.1 type II secretion system F family protein [Methylobacillus gramineus]
MNIWIAVSVIILLAGGLLLIFAEFSLNGRQDAQGRFDAIFGRKKRLHLPSPKRGIEQFIDRLSLMPSSKDMDILKLLVQAGFKGRARIVFNAMIRLGPAITAGAVLLVMIVQGKEIAEGVVFALFGFALFYIAIRNVLRWLAARRRKLIRKEISTFLHLLVMLFDSGLSMEHALRIMVEQADDIMPELAQELHRVLARISTGQDRSEALLGMTHMLDISELTEAIAMLRQVAQQGGNVRDSIMKYAALVEERQFSELREYVSKLSAKMTIVMMLFMFPALMIFIAGPGFIGLGKALSAQG